MISARSRDPRDLLRQLVIRGLPASSLRAACLLCVELDTPRDADHVEPQTEAERLESRQRIAGEKRVR